MLISEPVKPDHIAAVGFFLTENQILLILKGFGSKRNARILPQYVCCEVTGIFSRSSVRTFLITPESASAFLYGRPHRMLRINSLRRFLPHADRPLEMSDHFRPHRPPADRYRALGAARDASVRSPHSGAFNLFALERIECGVELVTIPDNDTVNPHRLW